MAGSDPNIDIDVSQERDAALKDLGKPKQSIFDNRGKKKGGTLLIIIIALAALGFVFMMKGKAEPEKAETGSEITIAQKKSVGKIKLHEPLPPPKEEPPKAAPQPAKPDQMELDRQRLELAKQERDRQLMEARVKSALVAPGSQNIDSQAPQETVGGSEGSFDNNSRGAQDGNSRFARSVSGLSTPNVRAKQITNLDTKILQGKLIEAILLPRANSDLPGSISCQVARDVYSEDGSQVLIPWGAKIFGQYNAGVRKGQDRLFVVWNRLVTPSGISITIDSPGADQLGTAGMGGKVDNHFLETFGASVLLSLIGAGATYMGDTKSEGTSAYYREEVYEAMQDSSETILSTYINIPPTINVAPGTRIRIFIARDIDFSEVVENKHPGQMEKIKVVF